ncbi:MAG: aminopeptidase P N-terminal domain-containing protein [Planctomycetota bacterium]
MAIDRIPLSEYAARRKRLLGALKKSVALIHAGDNSDPLHHDFHADANFVYLTGITHEPGAILLLAPEHPLPQRREALFLRPIDSEMARWDGLRPEIGQELRDACGIETVQRLYHLPRALNYAARRTKSLACVHPFAAHNQPVTPDLQLFRKVAERMPGITIEDHTETLARMRASKSKNEVALVQRAAQITADAYEALFKVLRPGVNEFDVAQTLEQAYRAGGARELAYGTIAGSGLNSTVAHYRANDATLQDGDVICIDSAAKFGGYCADVTRTLPVGGRFTDRQREVYDVVLQAQVAAVAAVKPGVTLAAVDGVARKIIEKAGFGDAFYHSIGHHLGLDVHDANPDEPLREGAIVTIEPGVYLPEERLGIRIEDDILVTKTGSRNLTAMIPKKAAEIEKRLA